jgi:hypothetical protein
MLSVHDVRGLAVVDTTFEDSSVVDDMVHVAYGDARFERCTFRRAFSDALDLELCTASITDCHFEGAGNDGVDLMTSVVRIDGCTFVDCGDKGTSIGQRSRARISRSTYERCAIGALVLDDSAALFEEVEVRAGTVGIDANHGSWRHGAGGRAWLHGVKLSELDVPVRFDRRSSVRVCVDGVPDEAYHALGTSAMDAP